MIQAVPDILAHIVATKREELPEVQRQRETYEKVALQRMKERRGFRRALETFAPAVIAEIKKASPSKGVLADDFNPQRMAQLYDANGAAAMSVLTDRTYFQGSLADLQRARAAAYLPVIRKDFTIDDAHVVEAAAHGADAILLIAAILETAELRALRERAEQYRMDALVEVHDEKELARAIDSGATLIGVNNRNLHTFTVSLETSLRLAERMPAGALKVSESGIHSRADLETLRAAGYRAFLVGEHLMKAPDPATALRALTA